IREADAVPMIRAKGLKPNVVRQPNTSVNETFVISQTPKPGERTPKNNYVTLYVSTGPPKTQVPDVVGKKLDEALAALQAANLKWKTVTVKSDRPQGEVIAQAPTAGAPVAQASRVRLQVSKGPTPVAVPNVIGSSFDTANSTLLAKGFAVSRTDVDRKSTRLNSSHVAISYAGFCLNKKI